MTLTLARVRKRLKKYRPNAHLFYTQSTFEERCGVAIDQRTVVLAPNWELASELAIDAWHAEDQVKDMTPHVFALYKSSHNQSYKWTNLFVPAYLGGKMAVGTGETWLESIMLFRQNFSHGMGMHTALPASFGTPEWARKCQLSVDDYAVKS